MTHQVLTVNRKKYAAGLFWQPMAAAESSRAYARTLARNTGRRYNLFTEYRAMIGLGARSAGHRSGMPSVAAEILDAMTEYSSFLAVFAVDTRFYLIAVRNGIILNDGIIESEADARARYSELFEIPEWAALIAPGAWGMPRAIERNLDELVGRVFAHATLRPIGRLAAGTFTLAIIGIILLGLLYLFRAPVAQMFTPRKPIAQIDPELAAEYHRQIEEKNRELDAQFDIVRHEPEPLVMPYDNLPDRNARADACYRAIGFLMQPIAGWSQTAAECGETHASANFRRGFGTLGEFYNVATRLMPASFVTEQNDNELSVRATLPHVQTVASIDERDAETVLRDITTAFQSMDAEITSQIVTDYITNGVDTAQLSIVEIAAESKLTPMSFMKIFDDFGGVYMTRCVWDAALRTWNYEVIIYAK